MCEGDRLGTLWEMIERLSGLVLSNHSAWSQRRLRRGASRFDNRMFISPLFRVDPRASALSAMSLSTIVISEILYASDE
jgi:hypothetical protein